MIATPPATLRLDIDTDALADNWRALDRLSGKARAGAAIKANCYGLGVDTCLPVLREAGCRDYFVAHWSEVEAASRHVAADEISVLHGPIDQAEASYARASGAIPVVDSLHQAKVWSESGGGACHLMVDTGINRLGVSLEDLSEPVVQALDVQVLLSHLACADEDSTMNVRQLARFEEARTLVEHRQASLANSAGIALGEDYHFDLTRPGLALYGGVPRSDYDKVIQQVAYPKAAIIQTRSIGAGDSVGYNATFTATRGMRTGIVSLGYADGILRSWRGAHFVSEGRALPILGKISMDMIVLALSGAPDIVEGDWVELPYALPDAARQTGLSQYELLTVLGNRFVR